jgi:hypothetical protein
VYLVSSSSLSILATKGGAVEVEGLTDVSTPDLKNASQWYRRGRRARSTAWTNVNDASSRSHWWVWHFGFDTVRSKLASAFQFPSLASVHVYVA